MGPATRQQALGKTFHVVRKIGYPDKWRDYSSYHVDRISLCDESNARSEFAFKRDLNKIGKPVDRTEWDMTRPL